MYHQDNDDRLVLNFESGTIGNPQTYMNGHWDGVDLFGSAKFTDLPQPDGCFTFVDEEESLVTGGAFVLLLGQQDVWWTVPGFRDRGCGANVAFADGHVQFHKWNYSHRVRKGHETPITSTPDREDLNWLLSHVPGAN